jgi:hypothetical protein
MSPAAAVLLASLAAQTSGPARDDRDESRSAWRFRREVSVEGPPGAAFAALVPPPELLARCQADLRDVRLLDQAGAEVPYALDRRAARTQAARFTGTLVDQRAERKRRSQWTVDLGAPRSFDTVAIDVQQSNFAKRVRVETSADGREWQVALEDAGIFERAWGGRLRHTTLALPAAVLARYVRVTADDAAGSPPVSVTGLTASAERSAPAEEWRVPVPLRRLDSVEGRSRYRLEAPPGLPMEALRISAEDAAFVRRMVVRESRERSGQREEAILGQGRLFRVWFEDAALSGESLRLPLAPTGGGEVSLEVEDGDGPALRGLAVEAIGTRVRLLFPAPAGPLVLYYGNEATRAPLYDLAALAGRLAFVAQPASSRLGPEALNPRFRRPVPIPMAPARGASLDVRRWRHARPLSLTGPGEDIVSLTLSASDMAVLRDDLGDLRVVDAQGQQVPFVLEPAASSDRIGLELGREAARSREGRGLTRARVRCVAATDGHAALPLVSLELVVAEPFFDRPARLLAPVEGRAGERVLFSGRLSRGAGGPVATPVPPLAIPLDGRRRDELVLEIEDGDNAPLTLASATGLVRVARVAFKAGPGSYRVLLGQPDAASPQYDLASLRAVVLAYSALPVSAAPLAANSAHRRVARDYLFQAPPTLLLWGSLALAVLGLLYLTARIVRQPPA